MQRKQVTETICVQEKYKPSQYHQQYLGADNFLIVYGMRPLY